MEYNQIKKIILVPIFIGTLLGGCGGSDSKETSETPTNQNPVVTINGENTIQEGELLSLIANASDTDGTIASIGWSVTAGENITLIGADSANVSFTAPNVDSDTVVTLAAVVTDDDGATATQSVTITITNKADSLTITGLVTDKVISNANVEIMVSDQSFSAISDDKGVYSVTINFDESLNQLLEVRAKGDSSINPEVEFVSLLGSLSNLIEQAGDDGILTQDENFGVNITNVTTAEYALITRNGSTPTTDAELNIAISTIETDEKNTLAALIKVVVDNEDFSLPNGVTSTLDLVDDSVTVIAFEQEVTTQNPTLITETISAIANDNTLTGESDIVGTWKIGSEALTFTRSGHYVHITTEVGENDDKIGYEIGSYSWNKETGSISFTTTEDSNGDSGLHDEFEEPLNTLKPDAATFTVTDNILTMVFIDQTINAPRLASDTNPIIGGFYLQKTNFSDDLSMAITLDDNKAALLFSFDPSKLPEDISYLFILREYSYDADTSLNIVNSQKIYVNGNVTNESTEEVSRALTNVQGDIISSTDGTGTSFFKRNHTTTTQDYLSSDDIVGEFNGTNGDFEFNITFNKNGTAQGSSDEGSSSIVWKVIFGQLLLTLDDGSTQIWSPTSLANDTWEFAVTEYDSDGSFDGSFSGTLTAQ